MAAPEGSDQNPDQTPGEGAGVPDDKVAGVGTGGPTQAEMGIGPDAAPPSAPEGGAEPTVPGVPQETHDAVLSDLEAVKAERDQLQEELDAAEELSPELVAEEEQPAGGSTAAEGLPNLTPSDELKQQWADQGYVGDPPEEA